MMHIRGTTEEVEANFLQITLYDSPTLFGGLAKTVIGKKIVSMRYSYIYNIYIYIYRGIIDNNMLKTEMKIHEPKSLFGMGPASGEEGQITKIQGVVNLGALPRYRQTGNLLSYKKGDRFLVVQLGKIANMDVFDDYGQYTYYATMEWGGMIKTSRKVRETPPTFNQLFYYPITITKLEKKNKDEELKAVKREIYNNGFVTIELWAKTHTETKHLGTTKYCLQDIQTSGKKEEIQFLNELTKEILTFDTRVAATKKRISTAFGTSESTIISLKVNYLLIYL